MKQPMVKETVILDLKEAMQKYEVENEYTKTHNLIINADNRDYIINGHIASIGDGIQQFNIRLVGSKNGSLIVRGFGNINIFREGSGYGHAIIQIGQIAGSAYRTGSGNGDAIHASEDGGDATRGGSGFGYAIHKGLGEGGYAIHTGRGGGNIINLGTSALACSSDNYKTDQITGVGGMVPPVTYGINRYYDVYGSENSPEEEFGHPNYDESSYKLLSINNLSVIEEFIYPNPISDDAFACAYQTEDGSLWAGDPLVKVSLESLVKHLMKINSYTSKLQRALSTIRTITGDTSLSKERVTLLKMLSIIEDLHKQIIEGDVIPDTSVLYETFQSVMHDHNLEREAVRTTKEHEIDRDEDYH